MRWKATGVVVVFLVVLALLTAPANAVLFHTGASGRVLDLPGGDFAESNSSEGPTDGPVIMSTASYEGEGSGAAVGMATETGDLVTAAAYLGADYRWDFEATADWSEEATNDTADPKPYRFDFQITGSVLLIIDARVVVEGPEPGAASTALDDPADVMTAGYEARILRIESGGAETVLWSSEAVLAGDADQGYTLTTGGTELDKEEFSIDLPDPSEIPGLPDLFDGIVFEDLNDLFYGYMFAPYSGSIDLGELAPGGSFTIKYEIKTYAEGPGLGTMVVAPEGEAVGDEVRLFTGAFSIFADPLGLAGDPNNPIGSVGISGDLIDLSQIPEPCTMALVLMGLAGLVRSRRRCA